MGRSCRPALQRRPFCRWNARRNGLRPARYTITKNDTMVVASEVGVMDFDPTEIAEKGRLQPGKILLMTRRKARSTTTEKSRTSWPASILTASG